MVNQEEMIVDFMDFNDPNKVLFSIKNFTSFTIERDFFTPADAFTLIVADDRMYQINNIIRNGMAVRFIIQQPSGKQNVVMWGYIFKFILEYSETGGTQLNIEGQDLLGFMNKGYPFPNLGKTSKTNFHFAPTDKLITAFGTICDAFTGISQLPQKVLIGIEDGAFLTFATGFATGFKIKGKTGRNLARSFQTSLGHLTSPNKGESYLAYLSRLAKHVGCNIKMMPGTNDTIMVSPPTYDRSNTSNLKLLHSQYGKYPIGVADILNNVLSGKVSIDITDQPSALIVEMATQGTNAYYRNTKKCIVVNELTGYVNDKSPIGKSQILNPNIYLPNIKTSINDLTSGKIGQGYLVIPPNQDLYNNLSEYAKSVSTEVSLPKFFIDQNAHNDSELLFGAAKAMAEAQDKFMVLDYTVDGLTQNGTVWYPNMMCYVYDSVTFGVDYDKKSEHILGDQYATAIDNWFWISKVQWTGSRDHYQSHITLSLPYTHIFDITGDK